MTPRMRRSAHELIVDGPRTRRPTTRHEWFRRVVLFAVVVIAGTFVLATPVDELRVPGLPALFQDAEESTPDALFIASTTSTTSTTSPQPTFDFEDGEWWVHPEESGVQPRGIVDGLLTFRGSPTRSFYGRGPVPDSPEIRWRFPTEGGLCRQSSVGSVAQTWCGTGWTGQPTIFQYEGRTWSVFGALDGAVHFLNARTGSPLIAPFQTEDIIKGSVTVDPDGFPIVYTGSRDNYYRAIAFDGEQARELWKIHADDAGPTLWNNDWDGSGLVLEDYLFIGGENSRIHIVRLNRSYGDDGLVVVDPELVFSAPGWDAELIAAVGQNVSIENSVVVSGNTLYFANSGGLVQGWDISSLREGIDPTRIFRYWAGDDVDATIVADSEGMLYVGVEYERDTARSREVGQLLKLDPSRPEDPLVWGIDERQGLDTGIWGTPALHRDVVIFGSEGGSLRAVDRATGEDVWSLTLGFHLWQSPVVVDDILLMGDCLGTMHAFDVSDTRVQPPELWSLQLDDGCIESTPAVWNGTIIVGTRRGGVYGITEAVEVNG